MLLVSALVAAFGLLGIFTSEGRAPWFVLGAAVLVAALALLVRALPRTHVFDRQQGTWTTHGLGGRAQHPLHEVLAVQMSPGKPLRMAGSSVGGPGQLMFELNLVLEGDPLRRTCLTCHGDGGATWQTGRYLGQFLGLPFLQQAPRPPAAPASGAAPAVRRGSPRLAGWLFAVLGTVILAAGVVLAAWSLEFYLHAGRAVGTVTGLASERKGGQAPIVTYEVEGKVYTYRSSYYSSAPAYRPGEKVTVLYRPEDPSSCHLQSFFEEWVAPLLLTGIGTALALVGFGVLNWRRAPAAPPLPPARPSAGRP
jgi:hypothetical protein